MLAVIAQLLVVLFGVWLVGVGALIMLHPERARNALGAMASTPTIHFGEHALRFVAGLAFVFAAERSKAPVVYWYFGTFMAISSVLIVLAPRQWHVR